MSNDDAINDFQHYLFDNADKFNSQTYLNLCNNLMKVHEQVEDVHDQANCILCVRAVSSMPSSFNCAPVRQHVHNSEFWAALIAYKARELQRVANFRLRSALATSWKQDLVESVLDDYSAVHTNLYGKIQSGIEGLLQMKIGMLPLIIRRLDALNMTPNMLFDTANVFSVTNLHEESPVLAACLRLEPRFLRWLLGMRENDAWPRTSPITNPERALSILISNTLIEYSNECGGDNLLVNQPCTCCKCANIGIIELEDDDQRKFHVSVYNKICRPRVRTYGYDALMDIRSVFMTHKRLFTMKRAISRASACRACNSIAKRISERRRGALKL